MLLRVLLLASLGASSLPAVIIDRIAIVIGNSIVKQSDIDRDMRVTEFLNGSPLELTAAARKAAANRLIDQVFIRREIRIGDYPQATPKEADSELAGIRKERYRTDAAFEGALRRYGLNAIELRSHFQWQLTVLDFIDARFKPAVYVTNDEIQSYYREHAAALKRQTGKSSLNDLRQDITNLITGEKVNKLFFEWLDSQRKETKISYLEQGLQ